MILDTLDNWRIYAAGNDGFDKAFEFLSRTDLADLPAGRHEIDGDRVFALAAVGQGKGRDGAILEVHRKYTDIQFCVSGAEQIGWKPTALCAEDEGFDEQKDLGFYRDRPETWVAVPAGMFAVFFPSDAHAVLGGEGTISKIVVKVAARP